MMAPSQVRDRQAFRTGVELSATWRLCFLSCTGARYGAGALPGEAGSASKGNRYSVGFLRGARLGFVVVGALAVLGRLGGRVSSTLGVELGASSVDDVSRVGLDDAGDGLAVHAESVPGVVSMIASFFSSSIETSVP